MSAKEGHPARVSHTHELAADEDLGHCGLACGLLEKVTQWNFVLCQQTTTQEQEDPRARGRGEAGHEIEHMKKGVGLKVRG